MNNTYELTDLILYAECPLKVKFKLNKKLKLPEYADDRRLISTALRDSYIYYFQRMGLNSTPSPQKIAAYFSKKCMEYKKAMSNDPSVVIKDTKALIVAHENVLNVNRLLGEGDELVAINYPVERSLLKNTIKDSIDMIVLKHQPKAQTYVELTYFDTSESKTDEKDLGILLRANLGYGIVSRELVSNFTEVKCNVLNVMSNKKTEITLERGQRWNYHRVIGSLIKGIEADIYYPRASKGACDHCKWGTVCNWKIG